jgi:PUA-domain protein
MDVKSRHHLRSDAVADVEDALSEGLGVTLEGDAHELVELEGTAFDLVLVDDEPLVLYVEDDGGREPFPTVRGLNALEPGRGVVTVDAGAVSFVSDGADVMRPGIEDADEDIEAGDLVAINEAAHGKFLAVGRARVDGSEMVGDQGKVVDSVHHVGDELYEFSV